MIEAILKITSENYYSCKLTSEIPVRVSLVTINGPEGFGIIESLDGTERPLRKYTRLMKKSSSIDVFEVLHKSEFLYWTRAVHNITGESILDAVLENGCMTRLPIIITEGYQSHTILAPSQKNFAQMFSNLKKRFTSVMIERIKRYPTGMTLPLLTRKQMDAISLAYTSGYYEMPRRSELEQLSKKLGIKRVAMQERLRRAEKKIITEFIQSTGV